MNFEFTIEDLIIAYRKVKSDIYFDNGHDNLIKLANYEEHLIENLRQLQRNLNSGDWDLMKSRNFLGDFRYILKDIEFDHNDSEKEKGFVYFSDPLANWEEIKIDDVSFRFIGYHSIDFHVLASLWIDKVGVILERNLSEKCYGSRLKRPNQKFNQFVSSSFPDNYSEEYKLLNGHFRPYYWDYKRWQDDGIKTIEDSLDKGKKVVVLTADIKKFYHSVSADFLLDERFYSFLNRDYLDEEMNRFTHLFVDLLNEWSKICLSTISKSVLKRRNHCGLPVGLSASKVIANLYLAYFDQKIDQEVSPIHYGRYVDDIILVLENKGNFKSCRDIWKYIGARIPECSYGSEGNDAPSAKFHIPFGGENEIEFGIAKEKLFVLEESSGYSFIETLKESMKENSSEWRLLPDSDEEIENLSKQIASSTSSVEEHVNSLRKSDGLSIQRLKFALRLRNFESLVDLVPVDVWKKGLNKFLAICENFIISPQQFPTYLRYYPRIVGLAVKADEFDFANKLIERFRHCWMLVRSKAEAKNENETSHILLQTWRFAEDLLREAIVANSPFHDHKKLEKHNASFYKLDSTNFEVEIISKKLFLSDLHSIPYKNIFFRADLYKDSRNRRDIRLYQLNEICEYTKLIDKRKILQLIHRIRNNHRISEHLPNGIFFYTRPFNTLELTSLVSTWSNSNEEIETLNSYLKLFLIPPIKVVISDTDSNDGNLKHIKINNVKKDENPTVALTSFYTDEKSWVANVRNDGEEPDTTRFTRLFRLINDILVCQKEVDYIVFPELSLPRQLILYIANKLKSKKISLIAGIEYAKQSDEITENIKGIVSNQLLYVLNTNNGYYNEQVFIIQEKVIPAFHEERELFDTGGMVLQAESELKYIIQHDKFFFSGLICNELLNIDYRQPLRGKIDALFVVEWNKDTEMYDPIISSTSNDLHCFMVQVNNRKYGDTRLRGPYKDSFERDKVRVRGGELDYFVVATIDAKEIREFQRNHRSPDKPFKPMPTGFKMSEKRRRIDFGNSRSNNI
jgi:hypothetical protein